ncbi:MAG: polysaccharide ABC transporter ATP-binding protein [Candidatus Brocadiia bacterium]
MGKPAVVVDHLWKRYHKRFGTSTLWSLFGRRERTDDEFWALKDVSFEVQPGECLGIIGPNGSGKSTLLKILSRITKPTRGRIEVNGRVASMLEVGTGFHPDLTGRENIYLNGAVLGMKRAEIRKRFDEIVAFSGVEAFIDVPVKRYSSGMYVRLAFAVAAHIQTDILIMDEVLAVGDAEFQNKCLGKMESAASEGRTVLFVSHNMAAIRALCSKAHWLDQGRTMEVGDSASVVGRYIEGAARLADRPLSDRTDREGDGSVRFTFVTVEGVTPDGPRAVIGANDRIRIRMGYRASKAPGALAFRVSIGDYTRGGIYFLDSDAAGGFTAPPALEGVAECCTGPARISPGPCYVNIAVFNNGRRADRVAYAHNFMVEPAGFDGLRNLPPRQHALGLIEQRWTAHAERAPG